MNIRKYIWAYVVAMALICPGVKAQEQITIGVIQYDVRDIDKSFKALHEQGFGSCELKVRGIFVKDRLRSAWYLSMSVSRSWTYTVK